MASNRPSSPQSTRRARSKASGCPSPDRTRAGQRDTSSASAILTVREASWEADPLAANPIQPPPATRRSFQLARAPGPDRGDGKRVPRAGACSSVLSRRLARSRTLTSVLEAISTPWPSTAARIPIPRAINVFPIWLAAISDTIGLCSRSTACRNPRCHVSRASRRPAPGPSVGRTWRANQAASEGRRGTVLGYGLPWPLVSVR